MNGEMMPGYPPQGNSNRNQFFQPHGMKPTYRYDNPNYLGKFKNNKYYQGPMGMEGQPGFGPDGLPYEGMSNGSMPPYHFMPSHRFNTSYRFNAKFNDQYHPNQHYPNYHQMSMNKQLAAAAAAAAAYSKAKNGGGDDATAETDEAKPEGEASLIPPPIVIDAELVNQVNTITSQMAAASAAGKEMNLTAEQQLVLQKHQYLVQQQQLQQQQQQMQANPLLAKKFPNYRLLGRNIFEPNKNQQFIKKKVKVNTYYSRFIKQHPTNNLPLAFQKSVSLAEDKALEEKEKLNTSGPTKTKSSKGQKKSSDSDEHSDRSKSRSSSSSRSSTSQSDSDSDSGSSSDGEIRKTKKSGSADSTANSETDKKKRKLLKKKLKKKQLKKEKKIKTAASLDNKNVNLNFTNFIGLGIKFSICIGE